MRRALQPVVHVVAIAALLALPLAGCGGSDYEGEAEEAVDSATEVMEEAAGEAEEAMEDAGEMAEDAMAEGEEAVEEAMDESEGEEEDDGGN